MDGIRVEQEKQATILVEEENASHGTLDDRGRLHAHPDRHDSKQAAGSGPMVADEGSRAATPALASVRQCHSTGRWAPYSGFLVICPLSRIRMPRHIGSPRHPPAVLGGLGARLGWRGNEGGRDGDQWEGMESVDHDRYGTGQGAEVIALYLQREVPH